MKNKKNTAGETAKKPEEKQDKEYLKNRVVLALSKEDAKILNLILTDKSYSDNEFAARISARIEKTINKHEMPKKVLSCRDNFATEQEAMEMPGDVMEAIVQATQEAEKEIFISDEDRAMQVNTEIRPEPGIISDRRN